MVALTFDDGPDAEATPAVLEALKAVNVKATFFVVAEQVEEAEGPALLRAIMDDGHAIQAHCGRHNSHRDQTGEQIANDVHGILAALERNGVPDPCLWRPPYGSTNDQFSCSIAAAVGLQLVLWTHDAADYADRSPEEMLHAAENAPLYEDSVILMHDSARYAHERDECQATVDLIPRLVDHLRHCGHGLGALTAPIAARALLPGELPLLPCSQ